MRFFKKRIYMDYAAATPLDARVLREMQKYEQIHFGNAGSLHLEGVNASRALASARKSVADVFTAHPDEIIFTGGGTEANNMAIQGVLAALIDKRLPDRRATSVNIWSTRPYRKLDRYHAITSAIEHSSVREVFVALEKCGLSVTYIGVSADGYIDPKEVKDALRENTALVSIMHGNNEIGTIQPIREIAKVIREYRKTKNQELKKIDKEQAMKNQGRKGEPKEPDLSAPYPFFHTDAAQSAQYVNVRPDALGVDMLTMSPAKMYGPKGVGVLYVRRGINVAPIILGGGQERGLRPGTENVAGAIGAATAFSLAAAAKGKESARLRVLREHFVSEIARTFPNAIINGTGEVLPHILSVSFAGFDNEEIVLRLDAKGIACSTKSACKSAREEVSYVVAALGDGHYSESAVRFSFGRATTRVDIFRTVRAIKESLAVMKNF